MVTINLNIVHELTPEERRAAWVSKTEIEQERDLVNNCIIPAVERYLSDIREISKHSPLKSRKKGSVKTDEIKSPRVNGRRVTV
jgi:hypothetical protein